MPLGGDGKPPRRGEVQRLGIAVKLADDGADRRASQSLLHRPQSLAGIAGGDMDELLRTGPQPGWIESARFEDRHPFLHPQPWLSGRQLRQKETGPAAIADVAGEQLGQCRSARAGQHHALAGPLGNWR